MKRLTMLTVLAAFLAFAPAALAKELAQMQACGGGGCQTFTQKQLSGLVPEGESAAGPPAVSPYYRLEFTFASRGPETVTWSAYYVPAARMLRSADEFGDGWTRLARKEGAALDRVLGGLEPFAKPELTSATVGKKRVEGDPASYLGLWDARSAGTPMPKGWDWLPIRLVSERPSPWTGADARLEYSPSANVLMRDGELVRLSNELAADVESASPLGAGGRNLQRWLIVAAALLAAALLASFGALAARRSRAAQSAARTQPA